MKGKLLLLLLSLLVICGHGFERCSDLQVLKGKCVNACHCQCFTGWEMGVWTDKGEQTTFRSETSKCMDPILAYDRMLSGNVTCIAPCPSPDEILAATAGDEVEAEDLINVETLDEIFDSALASLDYTPEIEEEEDGISVFAEEEEEEKEVEEEAEEEVEPVAEEEPLLVNQTVVEVAGEETVEQEAEEELPEKEEEEPSIANQTAVEDEPQASEEVPPAVEEEEDGQEEEVVAEEEEEEEELAPEPEPEADESTEEQEESESSAVESKGMEEEVEEKPQPAEEEEEIEESEESEEEEPDTAAPEPEPEDEAEEVLEPAPKDGTEGSSNSNHNHLPDPTPFCSEAQVNVKMCPGACKCSCMRRHGQSPGVWVDTLTLQGSHERPERFCMGEYHAYLLTARHEMKCVDNCAEAQEVGTNEENEEEQEDNLRRLLRKHFSDY